MEQGTTAARRGWRIRADIALPALMLAMGWQALAEARPDFRTQLPAEFPRYALHASARPLAQPSQKERDRIIEIAKKRYNAQVVSIEETTVGGRRAYVLRMLTKGKAIINRKVDAETGAEL